jgi:uncharacterized protein
LAGLVRPLPPDPLPQGKGEPRAIVIAAVSGRALVQAARRDGCAPLVVDLFGDDDTREAAVACAVLKGGLRGGIARPALLRVLERLTGGQEVAGLVYGSGFERRPELLDRLVASYRLLGNGGDAVRAAKDPFRLSDTCAALSIPHPEVRLGAAPNEGWLVKRIGGAGGAHVRGTVSGRRIGRGRYLQRRVEGRPISALFLAGGGRCRVLGFSEQWPAPLPRRPFRYGGAARPASLSEQLAERLRGVVERFVGEVPLKGLNSADFLVRRDDFHLLEINPRPGATLDLFAAPGLFRAHLRACLGAVPVDVAVPEGGVASLIAYARRPICLPPGFVWPEWASDRQPAGIAAAAGAPFCTVRAEAADAASVRALAMQRVEAVLSLAEDATR